MRKKSPKKNARKKRVVAPKPFNAGTMTNAMFFAMIRSALRQKSRWWKPISQVKYESRRPYSGPNKRQKFEYECNECHTWHMEKNINVDHIIPAGELNSYEDVPAFIKRLFCEKSGLQVLCKKCHDKKTQEEKSERKERKKATK